MNRAILKRCAAAALLIILSVGASPGAAGSGVTIRNDKFEVTHVVNGQRDMHAFRVIWNAKKRISPSQVIAHWEYKIDLSDGSRWLYDLRGYTQLVSVKKVPLYKIPSAKRFNKLIRADAKQPE